MNVFLFGGCVIGVCLVNFYLIGFEKMGVKIEVDEGYIWVEVDGCLKGVCIFMDMVSVGVIENLLMVVVLVDGIIIFENVVCEFEIVDLVNCFI